MRQVSKPHPGAASRAICSAIATRSTGTTFASAPGASASTLLAFRSTRQWPNAVVERVIGTLRRECLDHMIVLNDLHLSSVLREFVAYCNQGRPHRTLGLQTPESGPRSTTGPIRSRPVLKWPAPRIRARRLSTREVLPPLQGDMDARKEMPTVVGTLVPVVLSLRVIGLPAHGLCYVAAGRLHGYSALDLRP